MCGATQLLACGPSSRLILSLSTSLFDHLRPDIVRAAEAAGLTLHSDSVVPSQSVSTGSWGTRLSDDTARLMKFGWSQSEAPTTCTFNVLTEQQVVGALDGEPDERMANVQCSRKSVQWIDDRPDALASDLCAVRSIAAVGSSWPVDRQLSVAALANIQKQKLQERLAQRRLLRAADGPEPHMAGTGASAAADGLKPAEEV
jgi:hypothetical protein